MSNWKQVLINCYLSRHALASGEFKLTGGGTSDFYIDGRLVTTYPPGLRAITQAMCELIELKKLLPPHTNLIAPVLSGIPIVTALALELQIPFMMDRGAPKKHGHSKRFEGVFTSSEKCLIIDDLITVGTTIMQTIDGLRSIGKSISDVIVVVDREEGGKEALSERDVMLHSVLTKSELMQSLEDNRHGSQ
jgi:orotate phosphoribosyltransferase